MHDRAGDAAVEVEVADSERPLGELEVGGAAAEDAAGELVERAVGEVEGGLEVRGVHDGEDGAEDLLAGELVVGGDDPEDVRGHEVLVEAVEAGGEGKGG